MLELIEKVHGGAEADDTVTLPYELRQKSRQRIRLDSGREAALLLPPGTLLDHGDRLVAEDGTSVRVSAATEDVSTARSEDPLSLARAAYHLGNRHVPIQLGSGWLRYQHDHVLDEMVRGLGLVVINESARFEPERGAYRAPHHHDPAEKISAPQTSHGHSH